MKLFKLFIPLFLMTAFTAGAVNNIVLSDPPVKTICIKHPAAENAGTFFSGSKVYDFEIYKAGTPAEIDAIIKSLNGANGVESCVKGQLYGDYQRVTITLKTNKDKAWFIAAFKKAGLGHIRMNNHDIVAVDKL